MRYRRVVLLSSIALAASFAFAGRYLYVHIGQCLDVELASDAARLHDAYIAHHEQLTQRMQALAYGIAASTEIQRLLNEGNEAMLAEGDNASAMRTRRALQRQVEKLWNDLRTYYEVQQLHFMLPNGVSFLRMDEPDRFGDSMMPVRPMLADLSRGHDSRGSFEIESTYAGVFGAVAIKHTTPDGDPRHVGIIEVSLDMGNHLNKLSKRLNSSIALLLDRNRIPSDMLSARQPAVMDKQHFMLASTHPEVNDWLRAGLVPEGSRAPQSRMLSWSGRQFYTVAFAVNDYESQHKPWQDPPGTVLIWRDVTDRLSLVDAERTKTVVGTGAAYIVAQLCVLSLLYMARREWKRRLKQNTATVEAFSRRNAMFLDAAADGICGVDRNGGITFINRAALAMHGYRHEEVVGKNLHRLFQHHCPDGRPNPAENCLFLQTLADGEPREDEEWLIRRDGSCFPVKMTTTPIREDGRINGAVISFHDITEQRNRQEALLQLATTDSLTGTSNRRHFLDQLDTELARQRRHGGVASLLMTDLDFFKRINDEYGHVAGDVVLNHFVHIVHQTVRRSDIVGRLGGEEFAILLPGDSVQGARELAERLRHAFETHPAKIGNIFISATVSIGISELRTDDMSPDVPLRRADMALYAAKAAGRNCISIYDQNIQQGGVPAKKENDA